MRIRVPTIQRSLNTRESSPSYVLRFRHLKRSGYNGAQYSEHRHRIFPSDSTDESIEGILAAIRVNAWRDKMRNDARKPRV